jgi:hypothetical protein
MPFRFIATILRILGGKKKTLPIRVRHGVPFVHPKEV